MSKFLRLMSLLLACLMLVSVFTACGITDDPVATGDGSEAATEVVTDPVDEALNALRGEADWGGKDFGIVYINDIAGYTEEVEAIESEGGDTSKSGVINDAVFERNSLFEDYCNLKFVLIPLSSGAIMSRVQGEVQTATGDFQLITQHTAGTASAATSGYLYNYLNLDIDYEQEWWDAGTLEFALMGNVFFMDGPFNIVDDDVTFVMMFNKKLREEYKVANPYDTVKSGDWTLDYFNSIISQLATENGDGKWDEKDTYGFSCPNSIGDTFFYGSGLQYIVNNRDMDEPELVLSTKMEQALNVLAISRSIVHDNNSSYVAIAGNEGKAKDIFIEGRGLFYCEAASYLRSLNAEMTTEYGVIPIAKYDKAQENYTTWRHSIGSTLSIPTSVAGGDIDRFAKVLETYCLLSQKLVRPAYYEVMLTTRNVQDVESSEMLDLIFLHRTYDMAMYFDSLGFGGLFASAVASSGDNFSSKYAAQAKTFDRKLKNIFRKLEQLEK